MTAEKVIIIGGGVGPLAGVKLHEYIIENTLTNGTDQDHFEIYHLSRSGDIPDRSKAILSGRATLPAEGMFRTFKIADTALKTAGKEGVGGIPCNTFHAPEVFNYFIHLLHKDNLSLSIINMIEETAKLIKKDFPSINNLGLMSTTGTRKTRVYHNILEPLGFSLLQVNEQDQSDLHETIYNHKWGIKATSSITPRIRRRFEYYLQELIERGAQAVILGCTEIPLALPEKELFGIPLIDPMLVLARALIREANPKKLKKLRDGGSK